MGRGIKPFRGGGAGGGQVQVPGTRQAVQAERVKTTTKTVGEGLTDTLSGLTDTQIREFGQVLQAAAREAQAGDTRAAQTYALALNQLADQGVDGLVQWGKIVNASGLTPAQFKQVFPSDSVGGWASAQTIPVVERQPMVSPHSWAHILGSSKAAEGTRIRGRAPNAEAEMFPQMARFDNIRYLSQATGLPFQAVPGAPPPQGVVKKAFDMIDEAQDESGGAAVKYDFNRKNEMQPLASQLAGEGVDAEIAAEIAEGNLTDSARIPASTREKVIAARTQELLDRMPVATYPDDLGPRLKELLMGGEPPAPDAPTPVYQGSDFDPVAAQAALDSESATIPDEVNYGLGWKQEVFDAPPDTNTLGSMPMQNVSPLARLISTGDADAAPVWSAMEASGGLPDLRYAVGLPGYYRTKNMADEYAGLNRGRSPLEKALEAHDAVLEGGAPTPRVVQSLLNRSDDPSIRTLIRQNLGRLYDIDNQIRDWRRGVNVPLAGEVIQTPIPPDVLAGLYAKQLGIKDPNVLAQMVDPMTASSDIIGTVAPTGKAGRMLRDSGGYVDPLVYNVGIGGRGGVSAQQAAELKAMLIESIQMNNRRLKEMGRTPPILFPTKPKNQPPIINMQGASLMPESSRFDNSRVNPLMRLVG